MVLGLVMGVAVMGWFYVLVVLRRFGLLVKLFVLGSISCYFAV